MKKEEREEDQREQGKAAEAAPTNMNTAEMRPSPAFPSPNSQKKLQEGEDLTVPAATDLEIARIDR